MKTGSHSDVNSIDPARIVLADGHTTVKEAFEVANEMHDMAEEEANACNDDLAGMLSKGAAIIEMLAAKLGAPACPACGPTDEPCEHVPTARDFL